MTQPSPKQQLLADLRAGERNLLDRLAAVPGTSLDAGCYESGWNARQVLAHVATIEWSYERLIDLARGVAPASAGEPPASRPADGPGYSPPPSGGINDYNLRQVEKHAQSSVAELLDLFHTNRAATIAAVEQADDALFEKPVRSAGGLTGTLAQVLNMVAVLHVAGHVNDIVNAAERE